MENLFRCLVYDENTEILATKGNVKSITSAVKTILNTTNDNEVLTIIIKKVGDK